MTSVVNYGADETASGHTIVGLDSAHRVCVLASAGVDVVVDVMGALLADGGLGLSPVRPTRLVDTRDDIPVLPAGSITTVPVPTVAGYRPAAALVNITATNSQLPGYVTVWPCTATRPSTSNLNFEPGRAAVANTASSGVDSTGHVCVFTSAPTDVIVDLLGVVTQDPTALRYQSVTPVRLLDTRDGTGGWLGRIAPDQEIDVYIPAEAVVAVGHVTAVGAAGPGFLTTGPGGHPPAVSNLNYERAEARPNLVASPLDADGRVRIHTYGTGRHYTLFDLIGWFVVPALDTGRGAACERRDALGSLRPRDGRAPSLAGARLADRSMMNGIGQIGAVMSDERPTRSSAAAAADVRV
jgi:hypothetical protein